MRQLTNDQAAMLRDMRRPLRAAIREVVERRNALASGCVHLDESHPDCPVCAMYDLLNDACKSLEELPDELDRFLLRGPRPKQAD